MVEAEQTRQSSTRAHKNLPVLIFSFHLISSDWIHGKSNDPTFSGTHQKSMSITEHAFELQPRLGWRHFWRSLEAPRNPQLPCMLWLHLPVPKNFAWRPNVLPVVFLLSSSPWPWCHAPATPWDRCSGSALCARSSTRLSHRDLRWPPSDRGDGLPRLASAQRLQGPRRISATAARNASNSAPRILGAAPALLLLSTRNATTALRAAR